MPGRVCLITGATSGIGAAVAEALAQRGETVVIVGRDRARCEATVARIREMPSAPCADYLVADLSARADVYRVADTFMHRYSRLDVLVNNAGGIFMRRGETVDGIERTFALNHLAYFLLTNLLVEHLRRSAPARIVNVASSGHVLARGLDFDDLQSRRFYRGFQAYHRSKLANIMFTYEMARRLQGTGVTVNAADPGIVSTNIGRDNGWLWRVGKPVASRMLGLRYVSPAEGARTIVHLACAPEGAEVTGRYFADAREAESSPASHDRAAARRLWDISAELAGLAATSHD